jgi:hypothetical protein
VREPLFTPARSSRARLLLISELSLAIDSVDLLQQGRYEEIEKRLDPSMKNSKTRESLAEMASFFPSKPISTKTVDASVVRSRDSSITSITLQYEFARGWLLAQLVIQTRDGLETIGGFHVTPGPRLD